MKIRNDSLEIAKMVGDWLKKEVAPTCNEYDARDEFPQEFYDGMVEMGLNVMAVPEEYGGLGLDAITMTLIAEQLGRYECGLGSAVGANASATHLINHGANEEQKKIFYDFLLEGGWCAFGLTEPNAGSNAAAIKTSFKEDGDDYVINGSKCFITNGGIASVYVVMATIDPNLKGKGIACFMVERDREGLSIGKQEDKLGIRLSNTTEVIFDHVRIPKTHMIAGPGEGYKLALKTLTESRVHVAAMGTGLAARAVDEAIAYAKVRKQFDQPISALQSIQFKLADMAMQVEAARCLTYHAADLIDRKEDYAKFSSMAKCFGADTAMKVSVEALQVLGGFGYMKEYPMEKLLRDAKILQIYEGSNEIQRLIIASLLLH